MSDILPESCCRTVPAFMELVRLNDNLYDILYLVFYFIIPYTQFRRAVRFGDFTTIEELMPLWMVLFYVTGKSKYSRATITYLRTLQCLPDEWAQAVRQCSLVHITSNGFCSPVDSFVEFINLQAKQTLPPLRHRCQDTIRHALSRLNIVLPMRRDVEQQLGLSDASGVNTYKQTQTESRSDDIKSILSWFRATFGRSFDRRMEAQSPHSPIFPPIGQRTFDCPDGQPMYMRCESKMDTFDEDISRIVDRRLGAMFCSFDPDTYQAELLRDDHSKDHDDPFVQAPDNESDDDDDYNEEVVEDNS